MKINYKTLVSMRFAKRLSLVMLTLTALWFFQTQQADVGLVISDVGASPKSETLLKSDILNPTSTTPSVLRQKTSDETVILPQLFVKKKSTPEQKAE